MARHWGLWIIALPFLASAARFRLDVDDDGSGNAATEAVQKQLTSVLAAGNAALQSAEAEHEKVLSKVREAGAKDLMARAQRIGESLSTYAYDLQTAQDKLQGVINSTQADLTLSASLMDISTRARISAKISIAQREVKRAQRRQSGIMEVTTRSAQSVLEKESDAITNLWVGDMTPKLNEATMKMQAFADAPAPGSPAAAAAAAEAAKKAAQPEQWDDDDSALMDVLKTHGMAEPAKPVAKAAAKVDAKPVVNVAAPVTKPVTAKVFLQTTPAAKVPSASVLEANMNAANVAVDAATKAALKKVKDSIKKEEAESKTYVAGVAVELKAAEKKATAAVSKPIA